MTNSLDFVRQSVLRCRHCGVEKDVSAPEGVEVGTQDNPSTRGSEFLAEHTRCSKNLRFRSKASMTMREHLIIEMTKTLILEGAVDPEQVISAAVGLTDALSEAFAEDAEIGDLVGGSQGEDDGLDMTNAVFAGPLAQA